MDFSDIAQRGLVLLGCGKMGSAMLEGWLSSGLPAQSVWALDPHPSAWLQQQDIHLNAALPSDPALVLVAVKPQLMQAALPQMSKFGNGTTLFLSIAAGITIAGFEAILGPHTPIIRAMPNTPAAIGQGITALSGNHRIEERHLVLAEGLLGAIGQTLRLEHEAQMDAVTGVSGSGPAYVFYMIDCLAAAARAQGLGEDVAMQLAKATVAGAGALAATSPETPEQLRINVTSPNGTTQAGLEVLMQAKGGLDALMRETVAAAVNRSRDLANG
ncbi:MAG: pyrroline-5-carboxylate reductase [Rhodobacteraceae bacterium]|jgi:pyrroline-5-carboxylate reductase|nr:pyrroline-5-carboxylate reductase [Paracoccaceae bacterium]MBT7415881.1 pyrroline-5-carboxylate reductase [Paracoccaceae bacterium]